MNERFRWGVCFKQGPPCGDDPEAAQLRACSGIFRSSPVPGTLVVRAPGLALAPRPILRGPYSA